MDRPALPVPGKTPVSAFPGMLFLLVVVLAGSPMPVWGDTAEHVSLSAFLQGKKQVLLRPATSSLYWDWTVVPHHMADSPVLTVGYFAGPATPAGSELVVYLDGKVVAAILENPRLPNGRFSIRLGKRPLRPGTYRFRLSLVPGTVPAGRKQAGSWTQVDLDASEISCNLKTVPWKHLDFGRLPEVLAAAGRKNELPLAMDLDGPIRPRLLQAAQQVAAGVALRVRVPVLVSAQSPTADPRRKIAGDLPQVSAILGVEKDLPADLRPAGPASGPVVFLRADPGDPLAIQIVFSGRTTREVLEAAQAFAETRQDLPLGTLWRVLPAGGNTLGYAPQNVAARPGQTLAIHEVALPGTGGEAPYQNAVHFSFWMPGGLFAPRQSRLVLHLNLDTRPASRAVRHPLVTVVANHHWISQWKLSPGVVHYDTSIPFPALRAGQNGVTLDIADGQAGLLPGSTLRMPKTHQYVLLPSLRLLGRTGFPMASGGSGRRLAIWYLDSSAPCWSAGLTLFARLAQASRAALPEAEAVFREPPPDHNVVAVGTLPSLPQAWLEKSPVRPEKTALVWELHAPHSAARRWMGTGNSGAGAYLIETEESAGARNWVLEFLSATPASLREGAENLVLPANWDHLSGDFAWEDRHGGYHAVLLGHRHIYGNRRSGWFWIFLFSASPWLWAGTGFLAVLVAALSAWWYVLRQKAHWKKGDSHEKET